MTSGWFALRAATTITLAGCASSGGLLGPRLTGAPPPARRDLAVAIAAAKARLADAVRRDDSVGLVSAFTADATLADGADTLRGADVLWRHLHRGPALFVRDSLAFLVRVTDYCRDGAVERGDAMLVLGRREGGQQEVLEQPSYAFRWEVDAAGTARIRSAALTPRGNPGARAAVRSCAPSLEAASFARERIAVTVAGPASVFGPGVFTSWRNVVTARGYVPEQVILASNATVGATEHHDPIVVGVRFRAGAHLSAEALAAPVGTRTELRAVEPRSGNVTWLWDDARWGALLVGWEWRRVRAAAGPLVVLSDRRLMNHLFLAPDGSAYPLPVHEDVRWREASIGLLGQGAYAYPVTAHLFVEVQARWKLATGRTRPLQQFPGASFGLGGWSLGLAVGVSR